MRTVTVWRKQRTYRARVEPYINGWLKKRQMWRYVIESHWSALGSMVRESDWIVSHRGPKAISREEAEMGADEWLNEAEASNPAGEDYR